MKAIEQHFHVVLFIMLYRVVLTFKSVDENPSVYHSIESYWEVFSCDTVCYAVQGGSNSKSLWETIVYTIQMKAFCITFMWYCLLYAKPGSNTGSTYIKLALFNYFSTEHNKFFRILLLRCLFVLSNFQTMLLDALYDNFISDYKQC